MRKVFLTVIWFSANFFYFLQYFDSVRIFFISYSIFVQCEDETIEMVFKSIDAQDADSVQAMLGLPCLPHGKTPLALLRGMGFSGVSLFFKTFIFYV